MQAAALLDSPNGVFRRHHVGNNPLRWTDRQGLLIDRDYRDIPPLPTDPESYEWLSLDNLLLFFAGSYALLPARLEIAGEACGAYLAGKAPKVVTPGLRMREGQYVNDLGRVEPWEAYYDRYGRLVGRTDRNAKNEAANIPDTHYHSYEYNVRYPHGREVESHVPGDYPFEP